MIIGIDLGTTNSLISYFDDNTWKLIPNEFGNLKTPSVVSFYEDGTYVVGDIAYQRRNTHSSSTFFDFKREIGGPTKYIAYNVEYTAQELSTIVIKYLITQAERYLEKEIKEAVITVPAYFDDVQRHATKAAGLLAGIEVSRIINEPSSAALAYHQKFNKEGYSLVFDFGGGTLDISVLDIFSNVLDVLSIVGDTNLGGIDIDEKIALDFLSKHNAIKKIKFDDIIELKTIAEKVKIDLSTNKKSKLTYMYKNKKYETEYTNQILTNISSDILKKIKNLIEIALIDAKLDKSKLDNVICIGGSSNILFVRQYLEHLLGIKPAMDINPEEAVALGAGITSSIIQRTEGIKNTILSDVCPFSIGVSMIGNRFGIIIPKNSSIPVVKTSYFTTTEDYQEDVHFNIIQGDSPIASHNKAISELIKIPVEKDKAGIPSIEVSFAYDLNGILDVSFKSKVSTIKETIITNPNLDEAIIQKQKEKLNKLKTHSPKYPEAELLISKMESLHRQASYDLKILIENSLIKFEKHLEDNKLSRVNRAIKEFKTFTTSIENRLIPHKQFTIHDKSKMH